MIWTKLIVLGLALTPLQALAHDEGHGPKLTDISRYGGLLAPVIDKKDMDKGHHAETLYKAELVRTADGTVRVYIFDTAMKAVDPKICSSEATAYLETKVKGTYKQQAFALKFSDKAFLGKAPVSASKPYNIDVHLQISGRNVMAAFDNLD